MQTHHAHVTRLGVAMGRDSYVFVELNYKGGGFRPNQMSSSWLIGHLPFERDYCS